MIEKLYDFCAENSRVLIYTDHSDTNKFIFCTILAVNETEIAVQMISPDGEDDGIRVFDVNLVFRVEKNEMYFEKMRYLCESNLSSGFDLDFQSGNIKRTVLQYALSKKFILSIELVDSGYNDIVGFVDSIDGTQCTIRQIDEYGFEDGFSYVTTEDITTVDVLTVEEKRILKLWKLRNEENGFLNFDCKS